MIDCCIDSFENCFSLRLGNGFVYWYGTIIRVCIFSEGQKFGQEKKRRYIIHKCKVSSSSLIHRFRLGSIYFSKLDFGIIFFYGKKQVLHVPRLKADYGFCASVDEAVLLCIMWICIFILHSHPALQQALHAGYKASVYFSPQYSLAGQRE